MKKRGRSGIVWLLVVITILSCLPLSSLAAQYGMQKNKYLDVKKTPTGKTGQKITLNMVLTNDDNQDYTDVKIYFDDSAVDSEFDSESDEEGSRYTGDVFPFEVTSDIFNPVRVGTVRAGTSKNVSLSARLRRDIPEGYYSVPVIVNGEGMSGSTDWINIWVSKATDTTETDKDEGTIRFELGENQNTPYGTYPEVMNFSLNLRNASNITAFDINVRMGLSEDSTKFPFDINDGNYIRHIDRLGGGEVVTVPYSMAIRKEVYSGYYPITYTIEYRDSSDGDIQKAEEVFYVRVQNKEKEEEMGDFDVNDRTKARIIVDTFQTIPETIYAGEDFELILSMKNASENVTASNILFTLDSEKVSDSAVFTTDAGSSSFVVNTLGAGQTTELRVRLRAGAWAEQRTYAITINEKYDSPEFKNAEEKVTVDIPVKQMSRLNTGTIDIMPDSISVGSETNVMFPINNTGRVLLYNVMATFEGDSIQKTDSYVGNIKPGESQSVDAMITGAAPTMDDGKIKILITYEDENGVVSDPIEKEMILMVTEPMDPDFDMGDDMGEFPVDAEPTGIQKYSNYIIAGAIAALVVVIIVIVVVVKKRKKRKAEEEDIGDEI